YFIDFFTVVGGKQHDYSLHGRPGDFEMIGGTWSEPEPGTLAGTDVELGEIYDDPVMGAKDPRYRGPYGSYHGSGFQHLFNVRRGNGDWVGQWQFDEYNRLRLRVL